MIICVDAVTRAFFALVKTSRKNHFSLWPKCIMMRCSASSVASCTPFHCTKIYSDFLVEFATSRVVPNFSFRSTMTHFSCIEKLFSFHFLPNSRIQSHFQISHALDTLKLHHFPCPARSTRKKSFAGKLTNSTLTDLECILEWRCRSLGPSGLSRFV